MEAFREFCDDVMRKFGVQLLAEAFKGCDSQRALRQGIGRFCAAHSTSASLRSEASLDALCALVGELLKVLNTIDPAGVAKVNMRNMRAATLKFRGRDAPHQYAKEFARMLREFVNSGARLGNAADVAKAEAKAEAKCGGSARHSYLDLPPPAPPTQAPPRLGRPQPQCGQQHTGRTLVGQSLRVRHSGHASAGYFAVVVSWGSGAGSAAARGRGQGATARERGRRSSRRPRAMLGGQAASTIALLATSRTPRLPRLPAEQL